MNMSPYVYHSLTSGPYAIRLLHLLPHQDEAADIHCKLVEYSLEGFQFYRYDTLSYVWGEVAGTLPIMVEGQQFYVTSNLHAGLRRLRHNSFPRLLWVDAICINQDDDLEKEKQIQFMATIYSQANCVIVWLGEAADDSDLACEKIHRAAIRAGTDIPKADASRRAVISLLQRPWFRRIWVLQEVAAARAIVVMCGDQTLDGDLFCRGTDAGNYLQGFADMGDHVRSVCYLMRRLLPATHFVTPDSFQNPLQICPLGELVEMFLTHEATRSHDKIYALLGMCSDDLSKAGLSPDYRLPWNVLLRRLIKQLISDQIHVETRLDRHIAVIRGKGRFLGEVLVGGKALLCPGNQYGVTTKFTNLPDYRRNATTFTVDLNVKNSTFMVERGDVICVLQGSSTCTILRPCQDFFYVVMISYKMPPTLKAFHDDQPAHIEWPTKVLSELPYEHELLLVWNRETPSNASVSLERTVGMRPELADLESKSSSAPDNYEAWMCSNDWMRAQPESSSKGHLTRAIRMWNTALILEHRTEKSPHDEDVVKSAFGVALLRYQDAIAECEIGLTAEGSSDAIETSLLSTFISLATDSRNRHSKETLLLLAAHEGYNTLTRFLIATGSVDVNLPSSRWTDGLRRSIVIHAMNPRVLETPLLSACWQGHQSTVQILLDVDGIDVHHGNPLEVAARGGHEAVVTLLLQTRAIEVNTSDTQGRTPLWWAARLGHDEIVKSLLKKTDINVNVRTSDEYQRTPLFVAAKYGHYNVVRLLLETQGVEVDCTDSRNNTPLLVAAGSGHQAVVRLLLETNRVDVDKQNNARESSLWVAARNGHDAIYKMLLKTSQDDVDRRILGRTTLWYTAFHGHASMVKLLLDTGRVDVNFVDRYDGRSPLLDAVWNGHEAVVQMLVDARNTNVNLVDVHGNTAMHLAIERGHEKIVRILLSTSKIDLTLEDRAKPTPLELSKQLGADTITELLRKAGKGRAVCEEGNNDEAYFSETDDGKSISMTPARAQSYLHPLHRELVD